MRISTRSLRATRRPAFTLVELLVVIAIIGILVALLLPAIQAAREAARRSQCMNHVKQLAVGCANHNDTHKHFPTGGWGYKWVGDPDRGYGELQPGSWLFNILPFIEEQALRDMASDGKPNELTQEQLNGARDMVYLPSPTVFHCPSRRPVMGYKVEAHHPEIAVNAKPNETPTDYYVGAADYAANGGDGTTIDSLGPTTWIEAQNQNNPIWTLRCDNLGLSTAINGTKTWLMTGIMFLRSEVAPQHINDGTSKTYMLGERYLRADNYHRDRRRTGEDSSDSEVEGGDDWGWPWGFCNDNTRSGLKLPLADYPNVSDGDIFGSAHQGGFHMAFCDGHVESVSYDIDLLVHQNYANRRDDGRTKP